MLYYWRVHAASTSGGTAAKPYVEKAAQRPWPTIWPPQGGRAGWSRANSGTCHVVWDIPEPQPLVSILIPNKDHTDDLEKCLHSIYAKTTYENFEVIVIENNSTDPATAAYYKKLPERYDRARVVTYKGSFNFSRINNFGRRYAAGKYLLLLNNDVEVINGDWLTQMVGECSQPDVGLCGQCSTIPTTRSSTPASSRGWAATPGTATSTTSAAAAGICSGWPRCRIFRRDSGLPAGAHRRLRRAARPG